MSTTGYSVNDKQRTVSPYSHPEGRPEDAPKLAYAAVARAVRIGRIEADTSITFTASTVDFSPERRVLPGDENGANPFPPSEFQPGSVGDKNYIPLGESRTQVTTSTMRQTSPSM